MLGKLIELRLVDFGKTAGSWGVQNQSEATETQKIKSTSQAETTNNPNLELETPSYQNFKLRHPQKIPVLVGFVIKKYAENGKFSISAT